MSDLPLAIESNDDFSYQKSFQRMLSACYLFWFIYFLFLSNKITIVQTHLNPTSPQLDNMNWFYSSLQTWLQAIIKYSSSCEKYSKKNWIFLIERRAAACTFCKKYSLHFVAVNYLEWWTICSFHKFSLLIHFTDKSLSL